MTVEGPLLASFSCGKVNFEKYDASIIFVDVLTKIHTILILNTDHKYHLHCCSCTHLKYSRKKETAALQTRFGSPLNA